MDVYLSQEAKQYLKALPLASPKTHGFLIGHKRGHRFFVERVLPSSKSSFVSHQKQIQLNTLFEDSIIGFFSFDTNKDLLSKLLVPSATGKLFLEIIPKEENKATIDPYVIDYDKVFYLLPIKIKSLW